MSKSIKEVINFIDEIEEIKPAELKIRMKHIGDILIFIELAMMSLPIKGNYIKALKKFSGKVERWNFENDGYLLNDYVEQLDILFSDIKELIS